jgi:hypothetical protein
MTAQTLSDGAEESRPRVALSPCEAPPLDAAIASLANLDAVQLRLQWRNRLGGTAPAHLPRWLLMRVLAHRIQSMALGKLDRATLRVISQGKGDGGEDYRGQPFTPRDPATRDGIRLKAGAQLVREWNDKLERVTVLETGFSWNGKTYRSLSQIAKAMTGTSWNGHRFFGLRSTRPRVPRSASRTIASDAKRAAFASAAGSADALANLGSAVVAERHEGAAANRRGWPKRQRGRREARSLESSKSREGELSEHPTVASP